MKADVLFKIIKLFTEIVYVQLKYLNAKLFFFLFDQRGERKQFISSVDITTTRSWDRRTEREENLEKRRKKENEDISERYLDVT